MREVEILADEEAGRPHHPKNAGPDRRGARCRRRFGKGVFGAGDRIAWRVGRGRDKRGHARLKE